ncbi:hypothetical protein EP18_14725 [Lysinibacillus sphaericus]|nr:hypothetical protein [Lysinibacillus sphaericus]KEK10898.1 hypothetical protein EP18_14725 [Lysinibacillus sphaericus]
MYYPVFKNNNNEIKALNNLKESSRSKLTPIIESKKIKPENINPFNQVSIKTHPSLLSMICSRKFLSSSLKSLLQQYGL